VKSLPNNNRRLLRLKPAAEYVSLSTGTLRRMIQQGDLPAVITGEGAPWLLDVRDLDAWIESKKSRAADCR
jgi:excisionase family DNA binding protein